jgi:hypothetical protein
MGCPPMSCYSGPADYSQMVQQQQQQEEPADDNQVGKRVFPKGGTAGNLQHNLWAAGAPCCCTLCVC